MNFLSPMTLKASTSELPSSGVRVGVNGHQQTIGKHRVRFSMDPEVAHILRRGLSSPRLHIDGSLVNGVRIWCAEEGGMAPTMSNVGTWAVTVPVRRVRGRETNVHAIEVSIAWERDETGPVLLIPRVPDALLPEALIDKLPNSQVDQETRMERAEARLKRELAMLDVEVPLEEAAEMPQAEPASSVPPQRVEAPVEPASSVPPEPEAEAAADADIGQADLPIDLPPPSNAAMDLKEALAMVNEMVDQLEGSVVLSIDEHGHVQAKRRIIAYVDL